MMRHFSLTRRILIAVLLGQALLTAALAITAVMLARSALLNAFDSALEGRAVATLALVRYTESNPPGLLFDTALVSPPSDLLDRDVFEVRGPGGAMIAHSIGPAQIPGGVAQSSDLFTDLSFQGKSYRAVALRNVPVLDDEESVTVPSRVTVIYAASLGEMQRRLTRLGFFVTGCSVVLLLIANVVVARIVNQGFAPLRDLAATAGTISVRNWSFDPPADAMMARELTPLTVAIQTVLQRLKESFRQQRDFTSDAAHELKTSVAIVKSTLQSLLQRPREQEEYRVGLQGLLEDCGRLEDLLDRMLRLARIEQQEVHETMGALAPTELISTCEAAIARMARVASARQIRIELVSSSSDAICLRADPQDLELIWVNLLENALRFAPTGSQVELRVTRRVGTNGAAAAVVSVEDSGPGIPPAELTRVFERFHRADPSRARATGGFGLGLAICKALSAAYGGQIEALNRPTGGTEVRVHLPVESTPI